MLSTHACWSAGAELKDEFNLGFRWTAETIHYNRHRHDTRYKLIGVDHATLICIKLREHLPEPRHL